MARKKAKKRFPVVRFVMKFAVAVLVLIGVALVGLFLMPAEKIAGIAAARFEAATGRAMVLAGEVRPSFYPELGVRTGRVSVANADWSDAGPMLQAESLAVGVDLAALIGGDIRITGIEAVAPVILLEIGPDGRGNWEFGESKQAGGNGGSGGSGGSGSDTAPGATRQVTLDRAEITGGTVVFVDQRSGARHEVSGLDATVTLPDFAGEAKVKASGRMNGQAVAVDATIAEFAAFLDAGAVPVALAADLGGARLDFDGRAGLTPLAATGAVNADLGDMAGLFALLGMARPEMPAGLGRTSASVAGDLTYAEDTVALRGGTIVLDQNRLVGSLDLGLAGKPRLAARLQTGVLDLSGLVATPTRAKATGGGTTTGGEVIKRTDAGKRSGKGWSKAPIDASALGLIDAEVLIEADKVALGTTDLGQTKILTRLEDRRATVEIQELQAYDGAVSGTLVANGRGPLSVGANLAGRAIALKPLLSQLAGFDRLIAAGQMTIDVLGEGGSLDAIMNSLNGKGSFRIGAGEILGLDLVGMLRHLDTSFIGDGKRTIFDEITGSFSIRNGVLINDDLLLNSPLLRTLGSGKIGLGGQTLDYRLTPTLLAGEGKGLSVPLLITGSWDNPKFQLDLAALADQKLDGGIDGLEQKARKAVEDLVKEQLGIAPDPDPNAKANKKNGKPRKDKKNKNDPQQSLEDRAAEELRKLLNPN